MHHCKAVGLAGASWMCSLNCSPLHYIRRRQQQQRQLMDGPQWRITQLRLPWLQEEGCRAGLQQATTHSPAVTRPYNSHLCT